MKTHHHRYTIVPRNAEKCSVRRARHSHFAERCRLLVFLLAASLLLVPRAHAQLIADGTTNTLSNQTNTYAGALTIGTNGSFTGLLLTNGAVLTNSGDGTIGRNFGANSNYIAIASAGTRWLMGGALNVGGNGAFNQLVISDGSIIASHYGYVGYDATAHDNQVTITGPNSAWTNTADLIVGNFGARNTLLIADGGRVANISSYIGANFNANSNQVTVTGTNSEWSNSADLYLGFYGSLNSLFISNGGRVLNSFGYIGYNSGAGSNQVTVTGNDSVWTNSGDLYVGALSYFNTLLISNGGQVVNSIGYVGWGNGANSNQVSVIGTNSVWNSGDLQVGYSGSGNALVVSDGGRVVNATATIGSTGSNNSAMVNGAGSLWSNAGTLYVGYGGSGNSLSVTNGGTVTSFGGSLGDQLSATNNTVNVNGSNSVWGNNTGDLRIGNTGALNRLRITDGGRVDNANGIIGSTGTASNNQVTVAGANSGWMNSGNLIVGNSGSFNTLLVSAGGWVESSSSDIGYNSGAKNNQITVAGPGSLLINHGELRVGNGGSSNALLITNGGRVVNNSGSNFIGWGGSSANNRVTVAGIGSLWSNPSNLAIGYFGDRNIMTVTDGAVVRDASAVIGSESSSLQNGATINGPGSVWSNSGPITVGLRGTLSTLFVSNGGTVYNSYSRLGDTSGSRSNLVVVTDTGSVWSNAESLVVGYSGTFNSLLVSNGGRVFSTSGTVGLNSGSTNNLVSVTGTGSMWNISSNLIVGQSGSSNQLLISQGGAVFDVFGTVGGSGFGNNNRVVVTDPGSVWNTSSNLSLGNSPMYGNYYNTLVVSNGGSVLVGGRLSILGTSNSVRAVGGKLASRGITLDSSYATITLVSNSTWDALGKSFTWSIIGDGNVLTIDATSGITNISGLTLDQENTAFFLTNQPGGFTLNGFTSNQFGFQVGKVGYLVVGDRNRNVQLTISNYVCETAIGYIGLNSASNNLVLVSGVGSVWSNSSTLRIGINTPFNTLLVNHGGAVYSATGSLGELSAESSNNLVTVTDAGSVWSNSSSLFIGDNGPANTLLVSNGGHVFSASAVIGRASSSNNHVIVTGPGSLWSNSSTVVVGSGASFNSLLVSNGGIFLAGGRVTVGFAGSTSNFVQATGGTLASAGIDLGNLYSRGNSITLFSNSTWNALGNSFVWGALTIGDTLTIDATSGITNISGLTLGENDTAFFLTNQPGGYTLNGFTSNQFGFSPTAGMGALTVGYYSSNVQLTISNFVWAGTQGLIGNSSSQPSNKVFVTGTGSMWSNSGTLSIGDNGSFNTLLVSNGGKIVASNIVIGRIGTNNLVHVINGGVSSTGLVLGDVSSRNNNVTLLSNSVWNLGGGPFAWGSRGIGDTLVIDATSALTNVGALRLDEHNTTFYLTNATGGYSLNGWTSNQFGFKPGELGALIVGVAGTNVQLLISDFTWAGTSGFIGSNTTARSNAVIVSGANSIWSNSGNLWVGSNGSFNTLLISNGGWVSAANAFVGFTTNSSNNTLRLADGTLTVTGALTISSNNALAGSGTLLGTVTNFGNISPGNSAGSLTLNGNLRLQSSSMMSFEIGGLLATNQHDQLTVTSFAELAGNLSLALLPGFLPNPADSFTLLKFGSFSGAFANAAPLGRVSLSNNLASFAVTYTLTNLSIGGVTYADTDGDGQGDLQEQAAGTDPNSSASEMQIVSLLRQGEGPVTVRFTVQTGKNYRIEYSNDLVTWSQLSSPASFTAGPPGTKEWIDDGSQTGGLNFLITRRFYRVGLQ